MTKRKSSWKSVVGILGLCATLAAVIYAMRYTQSYQFRKSLEIFFNPMAPTLWRWCPDGAEKVELLNPQLAAVTPEQICSVSVETVPDEKATRKLSEVLTVHAEKQSKSLEADDQLEVFRVDGLIFQSQSLSKALKKP